MDTLAEGALNIASASSLDARPTIQPPRGRMHRCRRSQRAGIGAMSPQYGSACPRSEERRVGKECRSPWAPDDSKTKRRKSRLNNERKEQQYAQNMAMD